MKDCVFCEIADGRRPAAKVYEDDWVVACFDRQPVAKYHTVVIPKRHGVRCRRRRPDAMAGAIRHIWRAYRRTLGIEALQIVSSNGAAAQQETSHLHFHIVPRTKGDGQDIGWTSDLSIVARFDDLLSRLDIGSRSD